MLLQHMKKLAIQLGENIKVQSRFFKMVFGLPLTKLEFAFAQIGTIDVRRKNYLRILHVKKACRFFLEMRFWMMEIQIV